jgi:hypothetical protein
MMANNLFLIILINTASHSLVSNIYFAKNKEKRISGGGYFGKSSSASV